VRESSSDNSDHKVVLYPAKLTTSAKVLLASIEILVM
jgi:hypothetical protein